MKQPSERWWMVIPGPLDRTTGGTVYDRRMVEAARAAGDDVTVVSLPGAFPAEPEPPHREACRGELAALPDGATVCVDGLLLAGLQSELLELARRCRLVALVHHPGSEEPGLSDSVRSGLRRAESAVLRTANRVICTSAFTARALGAHGVAPARMEVVAPGVDPAAADSITDDGGGAPAGSDRPARLLCVANLIERKGIAYLLPALESLREFNWQLTIVGSDELEPRTAEKLYRSARKLGLSQRVTFAGLQSAAALNRLYADADLFVLPSLYEGYGMVLTEAAAHALPIVTTDGGAIPDTVAQLGAEVVPAGDAGALATAVRRFLTDGAFRQRLQARAGSAVERLPRWQSAAADFRRIIHAVGSQAAGSKTMDGFDPEWLTLRELADHASRDTALCIRLADHLRQSDAPVERTLRVLDLASGTGSNLRFLIPHLPLPQEWTLCDIDPDLLEHGRQRSLHWIERHGLALRVGVTSREIDLASRMPITLQDSSPDLVTASALLDLVSQQWLERVAARLWAADPCPALLAATVYNGLSEFEPADSEDGAVMAAFEADMQRDKGFGPALGGRAVSQACAILTRTGFSVSSADSSWVLDPALQQRIGRQRFTALLERQLEFFAAAAARQGVNASGWLKRRRDRLHEGTLKARIGHNDILALAAGPNHLLP